MLKSLKVKNPTGSFLLDSHVSERERLLAANNSDVALMQGFFAKVGLSRERSIKCARKTVIRDILTPRRLFYYVQFIPEFSLLSLGMDRFDADMVEEDLRIEFETTYTSNSTKKREIEPQVASMPSRTVTFIGEKDVSIKWRKSSEVHDSKLVDSVLDIQGYQQESDEKVSSVSTRERSRKSITELQMKYTVGMKRNPDDEDNILDMQDFFRTAGLSVRTSRSCAEESISVNATSPRKLYLYIQSKRITLEQLGMDLVDAEMVMEALWQAFHIDREGPSDRTNGYRADVIADAGDESFSHGHDSTHEFKSDSSEDITDSDRGRHASTTSDPRICDDALPRRRQSQIHIKRGERELGRRQQQQQQLQISSQTRPHSYYPSSYFNSLSYIKGQGSNDKHMLKLHSAVTEDGISNQFHTSAHSMGVSAALASLPSRPSSVHRSSNAVTVHTEMLLMRVASILKTKYGQ